MQLAQWLSTRKMTDAEFGVLVGRDQATISRTRRGLTMPGGALVAKIIEATGGQVQFADIYTTYAARQALGLNAAAHPHPADPERV